MPQDCIIGIRFLSKEAKGMVFENGRIAVLWVAVVNEQIENEKEKRIMKFIQDVYKGTARYKRYGFRVPYH